MKSADVPDERDVGLVVLDPDDPHVPNASDSHARARVEDILAHHGNGPRTYRNSVVFLAPDRRRLVELQDAARKFLAWKSIVTEAKDLDLNTTQTSQAEQRQKQAEDTVRLRLFETWCLLLVPEQDRGEPGVPPPAMTWRELRLQAGGSDPLGVRVSRKLVAEGLLVTKLDGTVLRLELDKVPLWRGDHVAVKTLADDFARYLYLPRLRGTQVLLDAIASGLANVAWDTETFAWAERHDGARYLGLRAGTGAVSVSADGESVVVKPEVAAAQLAADAARAAATASTPQRKPSGTFAPVPGPASGGVTGAVGGSRGPAAPPRPDAPPRHFHASVDLEATQLAAKAAQIAQEVLRHLATLPGARVNVTLEIHAEVPGGVEGDVVRVVRENCRTLGLDDARFEGGQG
ncbi:MAG: hypothetical protein U0324_37135 [Polyangiales bacterium]